MCSLFLPAGNFDQYISGTLMISKSMCIYVYKTRSKNMMLGERLPTPLVKRELPLFIYLFMFIKLIVNINICLFIFVVCTCK